MSRTLILAALLLVLTACGLDTGPRTEIAFHNMKDHTELTTKTVTANEDVALAEAKLTADLTAGTVAFKVVSPKGDVLWAGTADSSTKMDETKQFDPLAGEWKIELDASAATGDYSLSLRVPGK